MTNEEALIHSYRNALMLIVALAEYVDDETKKLVNENIETHQRIIDAYLRRNGT